MGREDSSVFRSSSHHIAAAVWREFISQSYQKHVPLGDNLFRHDASQIGQTVIAAAVAIEQLLVVEP